MAARGLGFRSAVGEAAGDVQLLMNALMNTAAPLLRKTGGFAPFAIALDQSGQEALFAGDAASTEVPAKEIAARLAEELRKRTRSGAVRAVAIASDVQFGKPGSDERRSAVELHIEHASGHCVDIFVPYRVRKGWRKNAGWRVRFSHPLGQESQITLFRTAANV